MSAPERIRAYLDARYAHQAETGTHGNAIPAPIASRPGPDGKRVPLMIADLEACLQTIDILARMLAAQAESTPEFVLRAAEYAIHIKEVPDADHTAGH